MTSVPGGRRMACLMMALGLALACMAARAAPEAIRVGLIAPLSGGSGDLGNSMRFGAELAVKEINEAGGYMGRTLQLVERDDHADPSTGERMARELVEQEKVDFTVGFCNTGVAMRALDVFQRNRHLLIVPCSQGTALTHQTPPSQSYVFRNAPYDQLNARFLVDDMVRRRQLRKVAVFADTTGYGEGGIKDLSAELSQHGLAPVYVARFAPGTASVAAQMKAAKAAGAEVMAVYAVGPDQAMVARSRKEAGVTLPYLATWTLSARSVLEDAGREAVEGTMMVQTIILDTYNERRAGFLAKYFRFSNDRPIGSLMAAAQSYDAVYLVMQAIFQTHGQTSGPELKAALESMNRPMPGVVTTYVAPFSPQDHDAIGVPMLWLGVWRNGEIRYHYAEDARMAGVVRRK